MKLRWWKTKQEIEAELTDKILTKLKIEQEEAKRINDDIELKAKQEVERIAKLEEEARLRAEAELKASSEPWIEVKGILHDPEKGISVELDWNDAFIEYLKSSGLTGIDDEQLIQKYLVLLIQDQEAKLSDQIETGDFE